MNKQRLLMLVSLAALLALIVACAPAPTATPVPPTKAPEPTKPPAPTATTAPAPTKAAEPTKAPEPTKPAAPKYTEAPMLAELVKQGKLPPVEQRLPKNPLVMQADEIGVHGGVWRRGFLGPSDFNGLNRIIYDALVRFSPDGSKVEMHYAESVTPSPDYRTWTVKLREGSKWSDGTPFTTDDIMFWYKDVLQNKDLTPTIPGWMKNKDGSLVEVKQIDAVTVQWIYKDPNTIFLLELANKDWGDRNIPVHLPSKWMKQFHAAYADKATLDKMVADAKFKTWTELFLDKVSPFTTPNRPGLAAWIAETRMSDQVLVLKRNPYFMGVDKAGNQLPYFDEIQVKFFADAQSLNLAAIAGELDQQERHIALANYPVLKEREQKDKKYVVQLWSSLGGADADVTFNQTYTKDPEVGKILANKDFRIAMSYAINRKQIQESIFLGTGEPRQPVAKKGHPYYPGDEYAYKYTEYNPTLAAQMLDKIGLDKKDAEGFRLLPSGKRLVIELSCIQALGFGPDSAQLIAKDWEKVGVKTNVQVRERALHFSLRESNDLMAEIWNQDTAGFPFTGSTKYDVRSGIYGNITYGPRWYDWYRTGGKDGIEPPDYIKRLVELVDKAKTVGPDEQAKIAQEMFRIWVDNMVEIGTVGLTAIDQGVAVINVNMRNIPKNVTKDWPLRTPGNLRPETWYYKK